MSLKILTQGAALHRVLKEANPPLDNRAITDFRERFMLQFGDGLFQHFKPLDKLFLTIGTGMEDTDRHIVPVADVLHLIIMRQEACGQALDDAVVPECILRLQDRIIQPRPFLSVCYTIRLPLWFHPVGYLPSKNTRTAVTMDSTEANFPGPS